MRTRIEIRLTACLFRVTKLERQIKKPAPAQAFLAVSEMHGLQTGGDRAHHADAVWPHVVGGQVGVCDFASGAHQTFNRCIEIMLDIPARSIRQLVDTLRAAVIEQKAQLSTALDAVEESAVIHQGADIRILAQLVTGVLGHEAARFARTNLADFEKSLVDRNARVEMT